jgi:hypothetical protein
MKLGGAIARPREGLAMATEQPNILLILADDVGCFDVGRSSPGSCRSAQA